MLRLARVRPKGSTATKSREDVAFLREGRSCRVTHRLPLPQQTVGERPCRPHRRQLEDCLPEPACTLGVELKTDTSVALCTVVLEREQRVLPTLSRELPSRLECLQDKGAHARKPKRNRRFSAKTMNIKRESLKYV